MVEGLGSQKGREKGEKRKGRERIVGREREVDRKRRMRSRMISFYCFFGGTGKAAGLEERRV